MSNPYSQPGSNDPQYGNPSGYQQGYDPSAYQQSYPQAGYQQQAYPQAGYQQGYPQPGYQQAGYPQAYQGAPGYGVTPKSKIGAALLAFFLGTLGIHNFYLGYTAKGCWQLGLTILGYITAILLVGFLFIFAVGVWAFVEFVMILVGGGQYSRDSRGVPLV